MIDELALCEDRILGRGALDGVAGAIERHHLGSRLMLVCDDTTYVAAGQYLFMQLIHKHQHVIAHSLGRKPQALWTSAEKIREHALEERITGIIAVGSGTVNDAAKYAAYHLRVPYICVATAASMNGYTSATASLEAEGMKLSFTAAPPRAVIADMNILCSAPKRMSRSGVGDTLCRSTVEADCVLSHCLLGTPYPKSDFDKMRAHEPELIAKIAKLKEHDADYMTLLMHALLDAGDAMARVGSSITASQGEHMIGHTLEMIYSSEMDVLHGEMIAVTTLTMNELHNKLILAMPMVKSLPREEAFFLRTFGKKLGPHVMSKYAPKVLIPEQAEKINGIIQQEWPEIKRMLGFVIVQNSALQRAYVHGNIPGKPRDIRIHDERYRAAVDYAYLTRNRFTFLDIAAMMSKRL